jgi:predicted ester cyclase
MLNRDELVRRYEAYLDACNRHAWDEIGGYLADSVLVNGVARSRREYVDDIRATISVFPTIGGTSLT